MKKKIFPIFYLLIFVLLNGSCTATSESTDLKSHSYFGNQLTKFHPSNPTNGGAINSDGTRIILTEKAGSYFSLWDAKSSNRIEKYSHETWPHFFNMAVFSPDSHFAYIPSLTVTQQETSSQEILPPAIDVIDTVSGQKVKTIDGPSRSKPCQNSAQALAVSADGHRLAALLCFNNVVVYDTDTWQIVSSQQSTSIKPSQIALSSDGSLLAMGYVNGKIEIRDVEKDLIKVTIKPQEGGAITKLIFSMDNKTIFTSEAALILADSSRLGDFIGGKDQKSIKEVNESARSWDVGSGKQTGIFSYGVVLHEATYIALSPDQKTLIVAKSFVPNGHNATSSLAAFDVASQKIVDQLPISTDGLVDVSFTNNGNVLCVIGDHETYTMSVGLREKH